MTLQGPRGADRGDGPMTGPPEGLARVVDRFDHLSVAVRSFDAAAPMVALMGGTHYDGGLSTAGDFRWVQYELPGGTRLELISTDSTDPGHFINRFLDTRGPGVHHVTFRVEDIAVASREAVAMGFEVVGFDDSDPDWKECFVHPRSANGVLIQLAQFPEGEDA